MFKLTITSLQPTDYTITIVEIPGTFYHNCFYLIDLIE